MIAISPIGIIMAARSWLLGPSEVVNSWVVSGSMLVVVMVEAIVEGKLVEFDKVWLQQKS